MKTKRLFEMGFGISLALALAATGTAATHASTSGGLIFTQAAGARAQGMGEAFTGIADDATGLFWNAGGLGRIAGSQVDASYLVGLADTANEQLFFTQQLGPGSGLGLGLLLFQGGMVTLDEPGGDKQVQSQADAAFNVGYGFQALETLGVGLGLKFLHSTLAEEVSANALAADLGVMLSADKHLTVGLTVQNIGAGVKYVTATDPLPLTVRLGAGYKLPLTTDQEGLLGLDLVKVNDRDLGLNVGAEYWFARTLALRLGYKAGTDLESLTAGFGVHWQAFELDYAFGLVQELNDTHKVSLALRF